METKLSAANIVTLYEYSPYVELPEPIFTNLWDDKINKVLFVNNSFWSNKQSYLYVCFHNKAGKILASIGLKKIYSNSSHEKVLAEEGLESYFPGKTFQEAMDLIHSDPKIKKEELKYREIVELTPKIYSRAT